MESGSNSTLSSSSSSSSSAVMQHLDLFGKGGSGDTVLFKAGIGSHDGAHSSLLNDYVPPGRAGQVGSGGSGVHARGAARA